MKNSSAIRCFTVDSNKQILASSREYTNTKRGKVIYSTYSDSNNKKNLYKGPIFVNNAGCLGSVGGFDTNNYSLLSSYKNGYGAYKKSCENQILNIDISNVTYEIIQGSNYISTIDPSNLTCDPALTKHYDLSYINIFI